MRGEGAERGRTYAGAREECTLAGVALARRMSSRRARGGTPLHAKEVYSVYTSSAEGRAERPRRARTRMGKQSENRKRCYTIFFVQRTKATSERNRAGGCCRGFERNRIPRAKPKRTVSSHEKTRDAPLFFLRVREPCVNARPRPVRRRAVRCLRPRPTPPRGVGPGPTRPPRRLGNARRGRRGAPARASPLGARRPEPHDRYPRARIVRAVEARRGARARRPPVRGATVGRSMMDERPRRGSSVRVERRTSRSRARRRVRGNRTD